MNVKIESNLAQLTQSLREYVVLSGKSIEEALKKQGAKLGYNLREELRRIAPPKGSIRAAMLARLKSHRGVKVRESVLRKVMQKRGARSVLSSGTVVFGKKGQGTTAKGANIWALAVQAEINLRESARGFLGVAARYGIRGELTNATAVSRFGPLLSKAGFQAEIQGGAIEFKWGGGLGELSSSAAEGLTKFKGERAINRALQGTVEDIQVYIERKLQENWQK